VVGGPSGEVVTVVSFARRGAEVIVEDWAELVGFGRLGCGEALG
jgi:hypothetical protein